MNIKTLTGSSIHSALIEARRIFGDDVVLLESIPAEGESLARITVMIDTPVPSQAEKKMPATTNRSGYGRGSRSLWLWSQ